MITRYAVMGNPIQHSLSPTIHQLFAKQTGRQLTYEKIMLDATCFEQQVQTFFQEGGQGLNITHPGKQRAFALCNTVSSRCLTAEAANTLWCDTHGLIHGDNTDGIGFMRDLTRYLTPTEKRILLLGAGGAARGVIAPLLEARPALLCVSNRTEATAQMLIKPYGNLPSTSVIVHSRPDKLGPFDLIIHATSSHLSESQQTLSADLTTPDTLCYDLTYQLNGATRFVAWARKNGCFGIDGLGMLVEQAAEAYMIWHGIRPDSSLVLAQLRNLTHQSIPP
jgi:shikimate dehydrogenase